MNTKQNNLAWAAVARFAAVALFFDALAPLFPQMAENYGISSDYFQLLLGICYLVFALFQLLSVFFIDRIGLSRTSSASCFLLGIISGIICVSQGQILFSVAMISLFAVNSIGSNATRVILREATSDGEFKRLVAWVSGWVEIKQIAMPFIAGSITVIFGWQWALLTLVAPIVIIGAWIEIVDIQNNGSETPPHHAKQGQDSSWRALATPEFIKPTLIAAAFQVAFSPLSARLPFILSDSIGISPFFSGCILSLASGIVAIGLFTSGSMAPQLSSQKLIMVGVIITASATALMISSCALGNWMLAIGIIIFQSAFGFIVIPCSSDALNVPPSLRTRASALFGCVQPVVGGSAVTLAGISGLDLEKGSIFVSILSTIIIFALLASARIGSLYNGR